jgi:tetratricopeptide (TPR) repeat protein
MSIGNMIERAREAATRRNTDLAIQIYQEALGIEPDSLQARREVRELEIKKWEGRYPSKVAAFFAGLPAILVMKISGMLGRRDSVITACERYLANDPKNVKINLRLGRAAAGQGYHNAAIVSFQTVADVDPRNVEALRSLGFMYQAAKDINQALLYFEKVLEIDPKDQESARARKDLAAEGALAVTGFANARHSRDLIKDKDRARDLEARQRVGHSRDDLRGQIKDLERMVAESPGDQRMLLDLADLYVRVRDYDAAIQSYERAFEAEPENFPLREKIGDLKIVRLEEAIRRQVETVEKNAEDAAAAERLEALRQERAELEVVECRERVAHHPTDLGLRLRLGRGLFRLGQIDDSIAEFQKTVQDPRRKLESLLMLGRCFEAKEMYDLAVKQLEKALVGVSTIGDQTKDILYTLGSVLEKKDDLAGAREQFAKIYEVDINYRDVSRKLEAISSQMKE